MAIIRVLGVDPGLENTGVSFIDIDLDGCKISACKLALVSTSQRHTKAARLTYLQASLSRMADHYKPNYVGVEMFFTNFREKKDGTSGLDPNAQIMNQVIGACLAGLSQYRVEEYTPTQVKHALTGSGRASKELVQEKASELLGFSETITPNHVADATAIAFCRWIKCPEYKKFKSFAKSAAFKR